MAPVSFRHKISLRPSPLKSFATSRFVPNPNAKAARLTGKGLATSDPRLNRALVMLCQLGG